MIPQDETSAQANPATAHRHGHNGHGAGATIVEEFEACEAAVEAFFALYETPSKVSIDLDPLERFGHCLDPIETLNSARLQADYGTEQEAVHQAVEAHWPRWQEDPRLSIQRFVTAVERRWLRTYTASELLHKQFPARREIVPGMLTEGVAVLAGKAGLGKGWWALDLCLAVAQGGQAFGAIEEDEDDEEPADAPALPPPRLEDRRGDVAEGGG
jgi:hypothetical protein